MCADYKDGRQRREGEDCEFGKSILRQAIFLDGGWEMEKLLACPVK